MLVCFFKIMFVIEQILESIKKWDWVKIGARASLGGWSVKCSGRTNEPPPKFTFYFAHATAHLLKLHNTPPPHLTLLCHLRPPKHQNFSSQSEQRMDAEGIFLDTLYSKIVFMGLLGHSRPSGPFWAFQQSLQQFHIDSPTNSFSSKC